MSEIRVDAIKTRAGAVPTANDVGINVAGTILQVQYTQYTGATSINTGVNTDDAIDVLAVNITPKSTSSIIRLDCHVFHEWNVTGYATDAVWFYFRDSTKLSHSANGNRNVGISMSRLSYYADDSGSTPEITYYTYFDTPNTTNQITYKVGVNSYVSSPLTINKTKTDSNTNQYERGISFISATEIGG